jgi:hypothetical protein
MKTYVYSTCFAGLVVCAAACSSSEPVAPAPDAAVADAGSDARLDAPARGVFCDLSSGSKARFGDILDCSCSGNLLGKLLCQGDGTFSKCDCTNARPAMPEGACETPSGFVRSGRSLSCTCAAYPGEVGSRLCNSGTFDSMCTRPDPMAIPPSCLPD